MHTHLWMGFTRKHTVMSFFQHILLSGFHTYLHILMNGFHCLPINETNTEFEVKYATTKDLGSSDLHPFSALPRTRLEEYLKFKTRQGYRVGICLGINQIINPPKSDYWKPQWEIKRKKWKLVNCLKYQR